MMLSEVDLEDIKRFLSKKFSGLRDIRLVPSSDLTERNKRNHRAFCQVAQGSSIIRCAYQLDYLDKEFRWGILLHETCHIIADAFDDSAEEAEIDVDTYIGDKIPEAKYHYEDTTYNAKNSRDKYHEYRAEGIECVSLEFVKKHSSYYSKG